MIDGATVPAEKLRSSARAIRDEAIRRGWKVHLYYLQSSFMSLERPDGTKLDCYSSTPPNASSNLRTRVDDKYLTHLALQEHGIPVSETYIDEAATQEKARMMLAAKKSVVVKPLDASHGNGVTVGITDNGDLEAAFSYALQYSKAVLVQEYVENPVDLRLLYIDYKLQAGLVRVPARVKGDGVHTVGQLIEIENNTPARGKNYTTNLNVISVEQAQKYLKEQINAIPPADTWTQVLGTANVGTGGETIDITDELPTWFIDIADKAARVMGLPVCGLDFLVKVAPTLQATFEELNPVAIEVNCCPSLFIHETPTYGKSHPVTSAYIDYLETL